MEHKGNEKLAVFEALQANGWHLEDDFLYSPHVGLRIGGDAVVPRDMVERMYIKMRDQLETLPQSGHLCSDKQLHQNYIKDIEIAVNALKELLNK